MASNKDKEENLLNEDQNPIEDIAEPELDSEQESSADINDQDEIENLQKALAESTDQVPEHRLNCKMLGDDLKGLGKCS